MAVQTQIQTRRGTAATWTSTNPTLAAGEIGFESDTGKFKIGTGSASWTSLAYAGGTTAVTYLYNATSGQTTFSGADANSLTLAYTVGAEQVYLNGVLLVRSTDYTATNGTSIVLASGAVASDVLNVIAYSTMTLTDAYTQAQANATFYPVATTQIAGKNKIINGDFGIWQRGTSFSNPASGSYTSDRWAVFYDGTGATRTISQQTFTPATAPVAGYEGTFFYRYLLSAVGTSPNYAFTAQRIEDVRTFAGQTVTYSFWAKAASGVTLPAPSLRQDFGSGGSTSVTTYASVNPPITTSWARYTFTIAVPSISGKTIGTSSYLELQLNLPVTANTIDIWGVQLEAGSVATQFSTASGGSPQAELAMCQRYYYRSTSTANYNFIAGTGTGRSTTQAWLSVPLPVTLRTAAATLDFSNLALDDGGSVFAVTAATLTSNGNPNNAGLLLTVASGLSQYRPYMLDASTSTGYVGFSAEL
jgi:hypothetical protein